MTGVITRARRGPERGSTNLWLLLLVILAGLVLLGLNSGGVARGKSVNRQPLDAHQWEPDPEESSRFFSPIENPTWKPGKLTTALLACLEEGERSDFIILPTYEARHVVRRWVAKYERMQDPAVTVFWFKNEGGLRSGKLSLNGTDIDGIVDMKRYEGVWEVVDARDWPPRERPLAQ